MDYYRKKISEYCKNNNRVFVNIKKAKCLKIVYQLLVKNQIYNKHYENDQWWFYLGRYYNNQKDYDNMIKFFLMAIDKGNSNAMHILGFYYQQQKDYENMMKYYLMAIDKG